MQYLWLVYWGIIVFALVLSIYIFFKKNKRIGIISTLLSITTPSIGFLFIFSRDYLNESEFEFLFKELTNGNILAYMIILLYIAFGITLIYNLTLLKKR